MSTKYFPFTTWEIEGTTIEEYDDDTPFSTLEEAFTELLEIYEDSDSYYGIFVYEDERCTPTKTLVNGYDFIVTDGKVELFTEEEAQRIRDAEYAHIKELSEEE